MTHRLAYLLGVVFLLAMASALADARRDGSGATGRKCRECAAYAPASGVYATPALKQTTKEPTP